MTKIKLRDYQDKVVSETRNLFAEGHKHILVQVPTGGGKCLAKGTKVLMYDGSVKKVESLVKNDLLMGVDSNPRTIKSTCHGSEEMYTISPIKGDSFTVNKSHILSFKISGKDTDATYCGGKRYYGGDIANVELVDYLESNKTFKHRAKIWRTGVSFSNTNKYNKIDPYFLGLWLADGNSKKISFTFHNDDVEVIDYLYTYSLYYEIRKEYNSENSHNYHFKVAKDISNNFKELNLFSNKHIPNDYKISTIENRLNLLAGILDGDGHLCHNGFDWLSVSEKLCDDVIFLCRSLGLACYKSIQQKKCGNTGVWGTYYRLNITGNTDIIPTKLKRKQATKRKQKKDVLVTGVKSIESIGIGDYYGFELEESDRLFILSDFTVTHNTIIFSFISQQVVSKDKKVLIITDRDKLLKQAGGTLSNFDLNPSYIKAGAKIFDERRNVFVGMSQTLRNRIKLKYWIDCIKDSIDLVIIDECHIQEFNHVFESGILDDKLVIGVTATPSRSGKMRQLGLDYDRMVRGPSVRELVSKGFLVNCDFYDSGKVDVSGVKIDAKTGDFQSNDMFSRFNSPTLYAGLLKQYKEKTDGQKMIVFCCNVEHAINTCIEFNKAGYKAKFVCASKSPPKKVKENATPGEIERYKERLRIYNFYKENYDKYGGTNDKVIKQFSNDEFTILVNVDILTKGYDEPSITVVALYRATMSITLYLQMIGRGSRIHDGKSHFTVLDFGGNRARLGNYDDNHVWSLWHEEKKAGGGVPPMKECGIDSNGIPLKAGGDVEKGCKRLIPASIEICPFCGFKKKPKDPAKEIELMLASVKDENGVSIAVKPIRKMRYEELKKYREIKKHQMSWLWRNLWMRGGEKELQEYAEWDHWSKKVHAMALNYCKNKLVN